MSLPAPHPGLVIRYAYLWKWEYEAGREEGSKDRPCAIIMAVTDDEGESQVLVLPITHSPPHDTADAVETLLIDEIISGKSDGRFARPSQCAAGREAGLPVTIGLR